ncbi:HECT domain containing protein [Trichuris trichiura]|uniref:HECT-type E3 ubiquitin transferase n=1 Tax=Trichuris trichiura TaxID=36087 RepID=A0A077YVK1_TRITR|nr:HECT domain containing protein [Trichuris trichiura]
MNKIHSGYFVSLRNQTILSQIPFAVPFEERLSVCFVTIFFVRRPFSASLFKGPIRVVMYNSASVPEVGVDGGGIFREFMTEVLKQGFSADYGFFLSTQDESELYPNWANEPFLGNTEEVHYFFGRLVGKAIYEELQVEPRFALFYLAAILYSDTKSVDFNYLSSYNRTVYNLRSVANYEGNFENLHLDFSIICTLLFQTFELIPGGANVRVVKENRREYVQRVAEFFQLIAAFRRGLTEMISFKWLSMFSPAELQIVISGFTNSINVVEWQSSTLYERTIVEEMTETEKSRLLRFVTSCSRPPLLGFASFRPLFTIQVLLDVTDRLPTSATCVNLLKLPNIPDALTLKEKLLFAIQSSSGFELC